jgi:hypothetical protein
MADNPLIGRTVVGVFIATDKKALRFDVEDGAAIVARADGDCCSSTWIESADAPEMLLGKVVSVEDLAMPDSGQPDEYEVVAYYGCKITTDKGRCVIDYRNKSNGYYGGDLRWPGDYYYGGVWGQNISTEEWCALTEGENE